jgi:hypothetical protein
MWFVLQVGKYLCAHVPSTSIIDDTTIHNSISILDPNSSAARTAKTALKPLLVQKLSMPQVCSCRFLYMFTLWIYRFEQQNVTFATL